MLRPPRASVVEPNGSRCPTPLDARGTSSRCGDGVGRALRRELSAALVDGPGLCRLGAADVGAARARPYECGGASSGRTRYGDIFRPRGPEHRSAGSGHGRRLGWDKRGGRRGVRPGGRAAGAAGAYAARARGAARLGGRVAAGPCLGGHRVSAAGDHGRPPVGHDRNRADRHRAAAGISSVGRHVAGHDHRDGHQRRHRGAHPGRAWPMDRFAAGAGLERGRSGGGLDLRRDPCAAPVTRTNRHPARGCGAAGRARARPSAHTPPHRAPPVRRAHGRHHRPSRDPQLPRRRARNSWFGRRRPAGSIP